jgi:transposase
MRKARTPAEMGFTAYDRRRLSRALDHTKGAATYRRIQAVMLIAVGYAAREVARILQRPRQAIHTWVERYLEAHRLEDLDHRSGAGRPSVAPTITEARLLRELRRNPLRLGYPTTVWTVALLAQHLSQRYHCPITARTLRRRMKQWGLVWKRARYVYANKEPHLAQKKGRSSGA